MATEAAGVIAETAASAAGTVGKVAGSALTHAAEATSAAAAESAAAVSQIPVVGKPIVGAVQKVGTVVGKNAAKIAKNVGFSGRNAKAIGTIAKGTTTNEINKQVLRPYNEIKDEITGLGDIKKNVKILDDIAHGRLSKADLAELVETHKEELADMALAEMDLPELQKIKTHVNLLEDLRNGKLTAEQVAEVAASDLDLPGKEDLKKLDKILREKTTKKQIREFIIENLDADEAKLFNDIDAPKFTKKQLIAFVKEHKAEIAGNIMKELDVPEVQKALDGVNLLIDIKEGKASSNQITEQVLADLEILNKQEIDDLKVLMSGKASKENKQAALLALLDSPDVKQLDEYYQVLKDIKEDKVDGDELQDFILSHIEDPEFFEVYKNRELLTDITLGNVEEEGLKAIIAESLGVKVIQVSNSETVLCDEDKDKASTVKPQNEMAEIYYNMGVSYAKRIKGKLQNRDMARYCFKQAAELGSEEAVKELQKLDCQAFITGIVSNIKNDKTVKQNAEIYNKMGMEYMKGTNGKPRNREMAIYCFKTSAKMGSESGKKHLIEIQNWE